MRCTWEWGRAAEEAKRCCRASKDQQLSTQNIRSVRREHPRASMQRQIGGMRRRIHTSAAAELPERTQPFDVSYNTRWGRPSKMGAV